MAKKATFTAEDDALLTRLGVEVPRVAARNQREERIIAGFEEIRRFVERHDRLPSMAAGSDIFERIYATRLEQIRQQPECRELLAGHDPQGLLDGATVGEEHDAETMSDEELLAELGVEDTAEDDITQLRHVQSRVERKAAEEIADRTICKDFESFRPLFDAVQQDLELGDRKTKKFRKDAGFLKSDIRQGQFYIVGGQTAYIAEVGEFFAAPNGQTDARLRVIYENGTESDLLLRSLQRALYKDETSRIITDPGAGPLFSETVTDEDTSSGIIYVLRSKSDLAEVRELRDVLHKIGVTGGSVQKRIANAAHDATYLLAEVELVATYELFNINRKKLEKLIHKFFGSARLEIEIKDRFGQPVVPREWFIVPLNVIDEAVEKIKDGTLDRYYYDPRSAALSKRTSD